MDDELDITKLKYVLYIRKSTDDPQRQVRSIDDQITECQQLAKRLNLHVIGAPIIEKKSAKEPDNRPLFKQMLRDIKNGKFDGIVAWNPDRLARNMKEGGEVIDMIDDNLIVDLKFVTHHFTRDANGKMLLGMAFVLSKQYSDNLSQNVKRGVRNNLQEGKTAIHKHGYIRDEEGLLRPHGEDFELMRKAWEMRLKDISLDDIADFMSQNNYGRIIKTSGKRISLTKQMLSKIFRDSFYFGNLKQGNKEVNLKSIYDFKPIITEKEYYQVQQLSGRKTKPYEKKRATYYPLKMMIICSFCRNHMYVGAVQGHTKRYLTYRCDNKFCSRIKKSIRGKVVFDFLYEFLKNGLNFTEKEYKQYLEAMKQLTGKRQEELRAKIQTKEARLRIVDREIKDMSYKILNLDLPKDSIIRTTNESRVLEDEIEKGQLKADLVTLREQLTDPEQEVITLENFLNLSKNAGKAIQMGNEIVKDAICRLLFLNFSLDEEKVLSYQAKPPFDELLKTRDILLSRDYPIQLEPLTTAILSYWHPQYFNHNNFTFNDENNYYGINDRGLSYAY